MKMNSTQSNETKNREKVGNKDRTFITRAEPIDTIMKVMKDEWRECNSYQKRRVILL